MKSLFAVVFIALVLACATSGSADPRWHGHWGGDWHGDAASSFWGGFAGSIFGNLFQPPVVVQQAPVIVAPPAIPEIGPGQWSAYCHGKYRTYDDATNSYVGYDGMRHPCA